MADAANFLSTPEGYATPEQLQSTRDYAKALLHGNGQQPVHHWTQGLSNIVSALVGGGLDYNAAQQQKAALKDQAGSQISNIPAGNYPDKPSFSEGPSSAGDKKADGGDDILDRAARVTSKQESGGNYQSVGNVTKNGDRAYGKYQVMGNNVPQWTAEALGKPMNIADFVHSPEAQDAVYKHKMGQYMAKYGPEGAARAWFAGEAGMKNPNATDVNHMSVDRYGKNFANAFARTGGAAPASGPQDASGAPAVQAIASALRGGPAPAAGGTQVAGSPQIAGAPQVAAARGASPAPIMNPSGSTAPLINPALIKPQPGYTHDQLLAVMSNPWTSPAEKQQAYEMALRQGQASFMPSPTGSGQVLIDPRNPQTQQFFADKPTFTKRKIGDIEREVPVTLGPHGEQIEAPRPLMRPAMPVPGLGPRSDAAPAAAGAAPVAAPTGAAPLGAAPGTATAENAPAAPAEAPDVPVQVASTDPTAGVAATVGKAPAQAGTQAAAEVAPLTRMAQAGPPPGTDPEDWAAYTQKQDRDTKVAVDKESQIANNKLNAKRYENILGATEAAQAQLGNLRTAARMMNDDDFYSGFGAEPVEGIKKIIAAIGGNPNAAAPMEVFRKTMASQIASSLKSAYGGLGQIRNKEIELQEKSNGSLNTSPAANRALVEISRRNAERVLQVGEMAQQYRLGHAVTDPISGKQLVPASMGPDGRPVQRAGLDPEYDAAITKFIKDHDLFSDDEYGAWNKLFSEKTKAIGIHKAGEAPKGTGFMDAEGHEIPAGAIDDLYKNPNLRNQFDSTFGKGSSDKIIGPHKQQEKADG